MKTLIIYDGVYGNTRRIAEAIGSGLTPTDTRIINVNDAKQEDLKGAELLIVGSPTYGGRPKPSTQAFLDRITAGALDGVKVAAFDTRFGNNQNIALRLLMKAINFAAPRIAKALEEKGGKLAMPPEGFFVNGKEGPLKTGEIERATVWVKNLK